MRCCNCNGIGSNNGFVRVHSGYSNAYTVNTHLITVEKEECDSMKISESDTSGNRKECKTCEEISFLVAFFNFLYYFLLIPFKTVLDIETNQYHIQTRPIQTVLCLVSHFAVVCFVLSIFLLGSLQLHNKSEPSIVDIFDTVSNFSTCVSAFLLIFILWRRREKYLELVESTRITLRRVRRFKNLLCISITIWSIAIIVVSWLMLFEDEHYASLRNLDKFLLDTNTPSSNLTSLYYSSNIFEKIFYMGVSVLLVNGSMFYIVIHGSLLMLVLTMTQLGKGLETELNIGNHQILDIQKGNELYRRLKRKADLIKNLYGNEILTFYITSVCYYAQAPHVYLGKRGNTEKLVMVYFTLTIVVWIVAAEFHKLVQETVLKWNAYHTGRPNLSTEDRLTLVSLSNEMTADPIAISSRYFCVTYQQFSAMLGLVITYGIIVFQQNTGPTRRETSSQCG